MGDIGRQINMGDGGTYNEINHIIINSVDYKNLLEEIDLFEQLLRSAQTEQDRLRISAKLQEKQNQLETLKEDVKRLHGIFTKIPINTERIRLAKEHFEKSEFREADAILKVEEIAEEVIRLKEKERDQVQVLAETRKVLADKSNEYLIKARLWKTFYKEPNWFDKTIEYFEKALDASRTVDSVFEYALFLQEHNEFQRSTLLYEEALQLYRRLSGEEPAMYKSDVAVVLNNMANLYKAKNENLLAEQKYIEALEIYRELSGFSIKQAFDMSTALNNFANVYTIMRKYDLAKQKYIEALKIRRMLAETNPSIYLSYVALTLNCLAALYSDTNECSFAEQKYIEALEIYRTLARERPIPHLPGLASVLHNYANLHSKKEEFFFAEQKYIEALEIRRKLAEENPAAYVPDVALTLVNFAISYKVRHQHSLAEQKYNEALGIYRLLIEENSVTYMPIMAEVLTDLADLHLIKNEYVPAEQKYNETLEIYRQLAEENPSVYESNLAMALVNLSAVYVQFVPDKERSIGLAREAVGILISVHENTPDCGVYLTIALQILQANGVDVESLIEEIQKNKP